MNKKSLLSAFLTAIIVGGLILTSAACFGTVQASMGTSGIPKPSVPEFTLKLVAHPYDVPPTYSIDKYTGENITHAGYHVENKSIELITKNQPFTPYSSNGSEVNLYYQVRYKGHYEEEDNWLLLYGSPSDYPIQSDSEYTVIPLSNLYSPSGFPIGAKLDIQVQALIGTVSLINGRLIGGWDYYEFEGEKSDWSNTQTITIGESQTPTSPPETTPTPTPTSTPYQEPLIGVAIAVAVIGAGLGLLIYLIKRK